MADNVEVRIVGDASGVQPAVDQAGASIGGLKTVIADINAFLSSMRTRFAEVGTAGSAAGSAIAGGMEKAVAATNLESNAVTRMIMKVHEGAESVRTFQMRAKEFAEVYVAIFAVEAVAHWVEALAGAAEKTAHLAATLGMTVPEVQALSGAATMSGVSMESLTRAMIVMDTKALSLHGHTSSTAKAFAAMGISAHDGRTSLERLMIVADKFHNMADGPGKVALAVRLIGKSGAEAIPFLNQGSAAIQQYMDKAKELGVVNEAAVAQGERMATSVSEAKLAWEGLKNTLTQAFGPILTELTDGFVALVKAMVDSYNSGGLVKIIFDGLAAGIQGLIEIVYDIGLGISQLFHDTSANGEDWAADMKGVFNEIVDLCKNLIVAVVFVADAFIAAWDLIKAAGYEAAAAYHAVVGSFEIAGTALGEFMKVVGKVVWDAMHLNWAAVAADWDAGMAQVKNAVQQKTNEILAITGHLRKQATDDFNAAMNLGKSFDAFQKNMFSGHYGGPGHDNFKANLFGGTGGAPDISPSGGKHKKGKDDTFQKLEEELEAKKAAWEKEQIAQDTAQQFSLQSEADFWNQALKRTDLSAKARFEITKKWIAAEQALQKDRISAVLDADKRELFEADKNAQAKLAIVQKEAAFIHKMYGDKSKEARAADMAVLQADREATQQQIQLIELVANARHAAATDQVEDAQSQADFEEQMGVISAGKRIEAERRFQEQLYKIDRDGMILRRSVINRDKDPAAWRQANAQIEALERQHQLKMNQIARQAALQRTAIERGAIQQIGATFGDHISKMITLQEGWREGLIGIYQGLVGVVASVVSQIVEKWIAGEIAKLVFGKAAAGSAAASQAAVAGAGGVASMAAAPFPMDLTAPAFGASMFATAMAYAPLAGAEGGDWNVNEGLYHLHDREMVLPSWAASPLRSMLEGGSGGQPSFMLPRADPTRATGNGDAHYHYSPTMNHHETTWDSMMKRSDREARRWFMGQWRGGRLLPKQDR